MTFKDFTQMSVWQKAYKPAMNIYGITKAYPNEEKYGLVSDMRRAVNSISNNIAEGFGRFESRDKTRFYKISRGSAYEVMNQLILSEGFNFISSETLKELKQNIQEIISELNSIIKTVETK